MASVAKTHYSPQQYLETERRSERKYEYLSGMIYAMAGASVEHNPTAFNLSAEVRQQHSWEARTAEGITAEITLPPLGLSLRLSDVSERVFPAR